MNALDAANNEGSRISATMNSIRALIEKHAHKHLLHGKTKPRWERILEKDKRIMRVLRSGGWRYKDLAARFNLTESQVHNVLRA